MSSVTSKILYLVFLIHLFVYYYGIPILPSKSFILYNFFISFFLLFNYFKLKKIRKNLFNLSTIFILAYCIIYFQFVFIFLLDVNLTEYHTFWIWASLKTVNKSIYFSTMGLICFLLPFKDKIFTDIKYSKNDYLKKSNLVILVSYLSFFLFISLSNYYSGEYSSDNQYSSYFYKIFKVFFSVAIITEISNIKPQNSINLFSYFKLIDRRIIFLYLCFCVVFILVGDRGPFLFFSLLFFSKYLLLYIKKSNILFFCSLIIFALLFNTVGQLRQTNDIDFLRDSDFLSQKDGFKDKIISNSFLLIPTLEYGKSIRTFNHSIDYINKTDNFTFGFYHFYNIIGVVPFLNNFYTLFYKTNRDSFQSSSEFITNLIQGDTPMSGDGTTILVDFYLDFGLLGIIFGMYLFGFFVFKYQFQIFTLDKLSISYVVIIMLYANSFFLARSSVLFEISNIVFTYIIINFVNYFRIG